jgi:hypothetical protein
VHTAGIDREKERERESRGSSPEREGEMHEVAVESVVAGEGEGRRRRGRKRQRQREEAGRGEEVSLGSARAEKSFLKKKPSMGAPDSLQCLSGAHRTAHSSCPVNHRTAHRKMDL